MNGDDKDFLSRFEGTFTQTRDDVNTLKQGYAVLQRDLGSFVQEIKAQITTLGSKLEEKSRTNWPAIGLAVSLFTISVPGLAFIMASYTGNALAPIASATTLNADAIKHLTDGLAALQQMAASSTAADANSRTDRVQLNDRVQRLETGLAAEIADRRSWTAETRVHLAEIEQQFHSVSNVENLRAAQQERINTFLWEKSHPGERYPNGTFFPTSIFQGPGGSASTTPP
jgi:septal ring factor EnvC (AmiA/AmiB activator)